MYPTYHLSLGETGEPLVVLMFGWLASLSLQFAWFANFAVVFGIALCIQRKTRQAIVVALVVCLLALNTFTLPGQSVGELSGRSQKVTSLGHGAHLWMASMFAFSLYICLLARSRQRPVQPTQSN
jgi:hypothetical protein